MSDPAPQLEYGVIVCRSQMQMAETIGRCLAIGWRLQGGVSITAWPQGFLRCFTSKQILFAQAIVREKKP